MRTYLPKLSSTIIALALLGVVAIVGCSKSDTEVLRSPEDVTYPMGTSYYISGIVTSGGAALDGVSVTGGGAEDTTDENGEYELEIESTSGITVTFTKDDYVDIQAVATFPTGAEYGSKVIISQTLTQKVDAQAVDASQEQFLEFNNGDAGYVWVTIPASTLSSDTEISATIYTPAATTISSSTSSISSPLYAIDIDPNGATIESGNSVTISVPVNTPYGFTSISHMKFNEVTSTWEDAGSANFTFGASCYQYEIELSSFSKHAVAIESKIATTATPETIKSETFYNIGNIATKNEVITYEQKSGWVIDLSTSNTSPEVLYEQMYSYIVNVMGCDEGVSTSQESRTVTVPGDTDYTISVEQDITNYTFTFETNNGQKNIYVEYYGAASTSTSQEEGDLRVDHN